MLSGNHITVRRGTQCLVDDVSAAVRPGELLVVLGPNGAGKTTLLRVLSGELRPSEGEVRLDDQALRHVERRKRARTLAVLPQKSALSFPFTALEVVLLGRLPHNSGPPGAEDFSVAQHCLDRVSLGELSHRDYLSLSGGEQQRVHIARVLAQISGSSGPCLLLDEPTAGLDPAHAIELLTLVRQLCADGAAVLAVLHDLNLTARFATRCLLLRSGRTVALGPAAEVLDAATLQRCYAVPFSRLQDPDTGAVTLAPKIRSETCLERS